MRCIMWVVFYSELIIQALLPSRVTAYKDYFLEWTEICPILESLLAVEAVLKFSILRKTYRKKALIFG